GLLSLPSRRSSDLICRTTSVISPDAPVSASAASGSVSVLPDSDGLHATSVRARAATTGSVAHLRDVDMNVPFLTVVITRATGGDAIQLLPRGCSREGPPRP